MNKKGFDAKYLPAWARKACRKEGFSPRWYEVVNHDPPVPELPPSAVLIRAHNARRSLELTVNDMEWAIGD